MLQNLPFNHLTSVGAQVSLENVAFEYDENVSNINICVRLKSSIKINIAFSLNILNGTALGKLLMLFFASILSRDLKYCIHLYNYSKVFLYP